MKIHIVEQNHIDVSKPSIKGPNIMFNLVWANTYISGYVMHNAVGIVVGIRQLVTASY